MWYLELLYSKTYVFRWRWWTWRTDFYFGPHLAIYLNIPVSSLTVLLSIRSPSIRLNEKINIDRDGPHKYGNDIKCPSFLKYISRPVSIYQTWATPVKRKTELMFQINSTLEIKKNVIELKHWSYLMCWVVFFNLDLKYLQSFAFQVINC